MESVLFIGLGRIGLPQALVFASKSSLVYGYDLDVDLVQGLNEKVVPFQEPYLYDYLDSNLGHRFFPIASWHNVVEILPLVDTIIFTVGTSVPDDRRCLESGVDLNNLLDIVEAIFKEQSQLKKHFTLIFRTTMHIGSVDTIKTYIENNFNLVESKDFSLAYMPERLMEGHAIKEEETLPKIVGVYSDTAFTRVSTLFANFSSKLIRVSSPSAAEFCKLCDNSYRSTLFAFANEIAMHANAHKIDVKEVIDAVNVDYPRNQISQPGFVSGYCLSKDPYIFECGFDKKSAEHHSLWYQGCTINNGLAEYVSEKVVENVKNIAASRIAILGLSFKEDVDDFRLSHAFDLINLLIKAGCQQFNLYDPKFKSNKYTQLPKSIEPYLAYGTRELNRELFANCDAVIIAHRHKALSTIKFADLTDLLTVLNPDSYIFDAWNIWRKIKNKQGFRYDAFGMGG